MLPCNSFATPDVWDVLDLLSDGRCIDATNDPPGQRSTYILPGDAERETYRLSTFQNFPQTVSIDVRRLAEKGFYYTGYKDRTKCFSCGGCVQDWEAGDDPSSERWHKHDCPLVKATDDRNIPIGSIFRSERFAESHRKRVASRAKGASPPVSSTSSADQATSSGLDTSSHSSSVANPNLLINPTSSAPTNVSSAIPSTGARIVPSTGARIVPSTGARIVRTSEFRRGSPRLLRDSVDQDEMTRLNYTIFPCLSPITPYMQSVESRLQTYLDHSDNWPAHRIGATPRQLSEAGMFYLGNHDRVKCWYCNGGLQNWERDDDAWEEHAKWFPMCEYVLQQKGPDFVHSIVARFPDIRRPILRNPSYGTPSSLLAIAHSATRVPEEPRPVIIDPREEARTRARKIDEEMTSSGLVEQAKLMGFEESLIRVALTRKFEATDSGFSTFESLVEAVLQLEENPAESEPEVTPLPLPQRVVFDSDDPSSSGLTEIRRLEEERTCKQCRNETATVVLIPCGHIACCVACSENISNCPICRSSVREKVHSFIV